VQQMMGKENYNQIPLASRCGLDIAIGACEEKLFEKTVTTQEVLGKELREQ
jgi:hypothetical protein